MRHLRVDRPGRAGEARRRAVAGVRPQLRRWQVFEARPRHEHPPAARDGGVMARQPATGVPDLPPDELEQWSNDLVTYLTSDRVPSNFRAWARAQADQMDAYMASAGDLGDSPANE